MAGIQELSPHLADLIAAGEVVERPASVAKELIENSIDAGATRIAIEIENGGITYLRITDNGSGIAPEDASVAFRRHATSKLRTEADLAAIGTLGFRGEALAAIASVSRIDLLTKQRGALAGQHLRLEAGKFLCHEEAGCPEGTIFIIRDLFFNTPARMKFLKKDFTEAGYILAVVQRAALSHPEIAFSLQRDGKRVFSTAGDGKLISPVFCVFGRELTDAMLETAPYEREKIAVHGYITQPHMARPTRAAQHFFVNGRYVKNRTMQAALEEAYRNRMITGKYPSCALFLELPLGAVDVNVHPAKTEVKFSQEKQVFETVYIACKNTLETAENTPQIQASGHKVREDTLTANQQQLSAKPSEREKQDRAEPAVSAAQAEPSKEAARPVWRKPLVHADDFEEMPCGLRQPPVQIAANVQTLDTVPAYPPSPPVLEPGLPASQAGMQSEPAFGEGLAQPKARVLGEAFHTYIVAEDPDGLLLIDKHAAHERMLFNQLRKSTVIPQQQLLTPVLVELDAVGAATVAEHQTEVAAAGFDISPFGLCCFAVRSAPAYLDAPDIPAVLSEMAERLASGRGAESETLDELIHMVACKAAIKGGAHSSMQELQNVCDRVTADPEVNCCPHGRPVTVRLTKYELDKLFKRVNQ